MLSFKLSFSAPVGALALTLALPAAAWAACDAASTATVNQPNYSPNALKTGVAPFTSGFGGFNCDSAAIVLLLSNDYLSATATSAQGFKLTSATTSDTISYALAADSAGATRLNPGVQTYYINGTTLNLLGLLGSSGFNVPVYVQPSSATAAKPGTYTGTFSVLWRWYFCKGIGIGGLCIGADTGSKSTTVTVNLEVRAVAPTVTLSTATTWDTENKAANPKSIPGARRRVNVTVSNPDIAVMDTDVLALSIATPPNMRIAFGGDGRDSQFVTATQGSTASGLILSYVSPGSGSDDVDFSVDGSNWTLSPSVATEDSVAAVRLRPKGAMAAKSSVTYSLPFEVK